MMAKDERVLIVGMGYVGLPLALSFVRGGVGVIGLDVDQSKVDALNGGASYLGHISDADIAKAVATGLFEATTDVTRCAEVDAVIIAVPTPLTKYRDPDLSYVTSTCQNIAPHLKRGAMVILESTTFPGTSAEVMKPILEAGSGMTVGDGIDLAYSPEREDPGNADFGTQTIPKLVGGYDAQTTARAVALYERALDSVIAVDSMEVAELAKLFENIFRAVNIALVNELKMVCDRMDIDVWSVIEAAATKPFGFMKFTPGPGIGGHCIPVDPFYLTWKAREHGLTTRFIELAGEINSGMPRYVIDRLRIALSEDGKALKGAKVLVLGVAYKPGVEDMRESPALDVIELLIEGQADVRYHDPFVPSLPQMRKHDLRLGGSKDFTVELLEEADAVLITTDHNEVDYELLMNTTRLVVDTRNAVRPRVGSGPYKARLVFA
ncbi:MAG: nucleotide sugar dehydrogenase [Myxococcota bacterium]|nr:nucleotide sugar dehydrogenase [Myxococcota bacterium]